MKGLDKGRETGQVFPKMINDHLKFIENQCFRALQKKSYRSDQIELENEALMLFNTVLDKLKANDYKILKNFKGRSKLTTYLTTIISFQAIDLIRKKRGRRLEKERAKKAGKTAELIYQLIFINKLDEKTAFKELSKSGNVSVTWEEFNHLLRLIAGKEAKIIDLDAQDLAVKKGIEDKTRGLVEIPDSRSDPEVLELERDRRDHIQRIVGDLVAGLSGEQQMILRMRYPQDGRRPLEIREIAALLKVSKKAVYNRLERILKKCKEICKQQGVVDGFL